MVTLLWLFGIVIIVLILLFIAVTNNNDQLHEALDKAHESLAVYEREGPLPTTNSASMIIEAIKLLKERVNAFENEGHFDEVGWNGKALDFAESMRSQLLVEAINNAALAQMIDFPEHWDTVLYPSLGAALEKVAQEYSQQGKVECPAPDANWGSVGENIVYDAALDDDHEQVVEETYGAIRKAIEEHVLPAALKGEISFVNGEWRALVAITPRGPLVLMAFRVSLAARDVREAPLQTFMFEVGKTYETLEGKQVEVGGRFGPMGYETLQCSDGVFRYDRSTHSEDAGRCTGTAHEYTYRKNLVRADKSSQYFAEDGTLMEAPGKRSIFDDVDE